MLVLVKKKVLFKYSNLLQQQKAAHYTTIVAATAAQSASLQFIAPYTGAALLSFIVIRRTCFNYL